MLKVLIVDDEMLIRKRLRYGFEWEELGFIIEGEAEDGAKALEMMMENKYDVAIVDIAMPGLNGVELTKELRNRQCNTEIIFLTGHSDFQYAKQAITYGVFDYILKPINEDDFVASLLRLKEKKEKQKITDRVMDSKLFSDFFKDKKLYGKRFDQIQMFLENSELRIEKEAAIIMLQITQMVEINLELDEILAIAESIFPTKIVENYYLFFDIYRNYVVIITQFPEERKENIRKEFEKTIHQMEKNRHLVIWCGISEAFKEPDKMMEAYDEALNALNNARIMGETILFYLDLEKYQGVYKIPEEKIWEFRRAVMGYNYQECCCFLEDCFSNMESRMVKFDCVVRNIDKIFLEVTDSGVISEKELKKIWNGYWDIEKILTNLMDYGEVLEWCENFLYIIVQHNIKVSPEKKSSEMINRICMYIKSNFQNSNLSQGEIADAMGITAPYLSSVFKKEMGISIVQYITLARMEKAKEYLSYTDMRVREISEKVGFNDEYYFSRIFKKYYGLSPQQMRK